MRLTAAPFKWLAPMEKIKVSVRWFSSLFVFLDLCSTERATGQTSISYHGITVTGRQTYRALPKTWMRPAWDCCPESYWNRREGESTRTASQNCDVAPTPYKWHCPPDQQQHLLSSPVRVLASQSLLYRPLPLDGSIIQDCWMCWNEWVEEMSQNNFLEISCCTKHL